MSNMERNFSNNKRGKKRKFKKILILEIIFLILGISVLFAVFYFEGKLGKIARTQKLTDEQAGITKREVKEPEKEEPKKHLTRYETLVLYGLDSRQNQLDGGTNSDVMIICAIDNDKKQIRLLSIYRDTYMDNGSENGNIILKRANSAFLYGYDRSIRMINRNLDLDVKSYVSASFAAVTKAVDAFGGIEVELTDKEAKQINRYLKETAKVAGVPCRFLQTGGKIILDGAQATTYARIRKGVGDDFSRANRQRIVIKKLFEKARKFDVIQLNRAMDTVLPYISTNLDNSQILDYVKDLATYDIVETAAFPFDFTTTYVGKAAVIVPINLNKNVLDVHRYLYPEKDPDYDTSQLVKTISYTIRNRTGVNDNTPKLEIEYYNGEDANKVGNSMNKPENIPSEKEENSDKSDSDKQKDIKSSGTDNSKNVNKTP